jgi:hypothetical protein
VNEDEPFVLGLRFCKMGDQAYLWEGKISFFDFSFPNRNRRIDCALDRFFKEIEE